MTDNNIDDYIEQFSEHLVNYVYFTVDDVDRLEPGSHIRFITRKGKLASGGFLLKVLEKDRKEDTVLMIRGFKGKRFYIRPYFYNIFYKSNTYFKERGKTKNRIFKNILTSL